ncbi:outer membrane autotransporter [Escherichia coli]|uniref:Outer membrane autotransporter n=1 Tax=Escherichia coli TaxID=562 RepID=A0A376ZWH2_ECOLX|nr:outer membrane autotransporter [Escherichia coli]
MGYSGIQFGGDKRLSDVMPLYVGLYIGSTHASPDYSGGDGTARSDYMGMYASYMAQNGFYSDLVIKHRARKIVSTYWTVRTTALTPTALRME